LELCLYSFSQGEQLLIEVEAPARGQYRQKVPSRPNITLLHGKIFRFTGNSGILELEAAPARKNHCESIETRVVKHRGSYRLLVNLGGSYLPGPAGLLSACTQNLTYSLRPIGFRSGRRGKPG
jgi:hypothetical protein